MVFCLIWKADELERWRKEAMEGVSLSLLLHGYKMCARAYLNGDGSGKGLISTFFRNHARTIWCTATLAFSPEGHADAHQSTKLGRNTRVIVSVLTSTPAPSSDQEERRWTLHHDAPCLFGSNTCWMEALGKMTQYTYECWWILQTSQRSSHEGFEELKFKMSNSVHWNKFWCWHLPIYLQQLASLFELAQEQILLYTVIEIVMGKHNWTDKKLQRELKSTVHAVMWIGNLLAGSW